MISNYIAEYEFHITHLIEKINLTLAMYNNDQDPHNNVEMHEQIAESIILTGFLGMYIPNFVDLCEDEELYYLWNKHSGHQRQGDHEYAKGMVDYGQLARVRPQSRRSFTSTSRRPNASIPALMAA